MIVKQTAQLRNANKNYVNFKKKIDKLVNVIKDKPEHLKSIEFIETPIKDLLKSKDEI